MTQEKPKRAFWVGQGLEPRPEFHEKISRDGKKNEIRALSGEKRRNFGQSQRRAVQRRAVHGGGPGRSGPAQGGPRMGSREERSREGRSLGWRPPEERSREGPGP